ncbi:hypothetical protein AB9Q10_45630 [Streptomyces krungchingensis]|uniref:hypothetical protein n=1 Tax=Streptomyces krungchingensis TaxID=1565034 RepID=UPI003CF7792C
MPAFADIAMVDVVATVVRGRSAPGPACSGRPAIALADHTVRGLAFSGHDRSTTAVPTVSSGGGEWYDTIELSSARSAPVLGRAPSAPWPRLTWKAGYPGPLIARPDRITVKIPDLPVEPQLGSTDRARIAAITFEAPIGSVLAFSNAPAHAPDATVRAETITVLAQGRRDKEVAGGDDSAPSAALPVSTRSDSAAEALRML